MSAPKQNGSHDNRGELRKRKKTRSKPASERRKEATLTSDQHKKAVPAYKKKRSKATPARLIAREVLAKTRVRQAYVREILNTKRENLQSSNQDFEEREFDFAQVLCFGVVATCGTLDEFIDSNLSSAKDIKANVRDCLRISAYELLFLDHEPYVVVDQGVELVKSVNFRAAGLANAVLRKMSRSVQNFFAGDTVDAIARRAGIQTWICESMIEVYGQDKAIEMLNDMLLPAPTYLVNAPKGRLATDLAAQFIASLVFLQGSILEIGAGRGTKTALLQMRALKEMERGEMERPSNIYALDIHGYKAKILQERLVELGLPGVKTVNADGRKVHELCQAGKLPKSFDCVFLDVPCSGTGTFRRHPEARWRLSPQSIADLSQLQFELLTSAAQCLKKGGSIIYSTCSILPKENKEVIERFLETPMGKNFELQAIKKDLPEKNWHYIDELMFQSLPAKNLSDGHFAAILKRVS